MVRVMLGSWFQDLALKLCISKVKIGTRYSSRIQSMHCMWTILSCYNAYMKVKDWVVPFFEVPFSDWLLTSWKLEWNWSDGSFKFVYNFIHSFYWYWFFSLYAYGTADKNSSSMATRPSPSKMEWIIPLIVVSALTFVCLILLIAVLVYWRWACFF